MIKHKPILPKVKRSIYIVLILAIFASHTLISYEVLKRSQITQKGGYILNGLSNYKKIFLTPEIKIIKKLSSILSIENEEYHPHLFSLIEALIWKILRVMKIIDVDALVITTNSLFLLILLISVYGIGATIYNENVGILSVLLLSTFSIVFASTRIALLDFPLMCMISLSIYLLLKTNGFQSTLYSILAGIAFGLSQLTKEACIIFVFAPFIYYFVKSCLPSKKNKVILNFIISVLFFIVVLGIAYFTPASLGALKTYMSKISSRYVNDPLYYFRYFKKMTGPFILIPSLLLLLSYLVNIKKRNKLIFLWLVIPFILFNISFNKTIRFLLPILPAFAIIVAGEVFSSDSLFKRIKVTFIFVLAILSISQYALLNFGFLDKDNAYDYLEQGLSSVQKDKDMPGVLTLFDIFRKETKVYKNSIKEILFLYNNLAIIAALRLHFAMNDLDLNIACPAEADQTDYLQFYSQDVDWSKKVLFADYIVVQILPDKFVPEHAKHIIQDLREWFNKYKNQFKMIAEIEVYHSPNIYVYKRIKK